MKRKRRCVDCRLGSENVQLLNWERQLVFPAWKPTWIEVQLRSARSYAPFDNGSTRFGILKKSLTRPPGNVSERFCAMKGWFTRHARFWIIQSGIMLSRGMIFFPNHKVGNASLWCKVVVKSRLPKKKLGMGAHDLADVCFFDLWCLPCFFPLFISWPPFSEYIPL